MITPVSGTQICDLLNVRKSYRGKMNQPNYPKSKLTVEVMVIAIPEASAATICEVPGLKMLLSICWQFELAERQEDARR